MVSIIENTQRENLLPLEEAEAVARLIQIHGMNQTTAAKAVGKGRLVINQLLKINSLPDDIKTESIELNTPKSILVELASIKSQADQFKLWQNASDGGLTIPDIRSFKRKGSDTKSTGKSDTKKTNKASPTDIAIQHGERFTGQLEKLDVASLSKVDRAVLSSLAKKASDILSS